MKVPKILEMPGKMYEALLKMNVYKYFIIEGGRGSGKTHSVARILLYLCEMYGVRIVCGREVQDTIEESVYTVFSDLIREYSLGFDVKKVGITHLSSGGEIRFKGFREHGSINIKGVEGADVVWVDEAQSLSKATLDVLIPTLRKDNGKFFFTLNRFSEDDAVMDYVSREDCLHVKLNYYDNPYCPNTLKNEAELCRVKNEADYRHIWLGEPRNFSDDCLFSSEILERSIDLVVNDGEVMRQRSMGIDFAAQGNDFCVATTIDRVSGRCWEVVDRVRWQHKDTEQSIGKIVNLVSRAKPDVTMLDIGNMGYTVMCALNGMGMNIMPFDGGSKNGVEGRYYNARAEGYWLLQQWFEEMNLILHERDRDVIKQLLKVKVKHRPDGKRQLQSKVEMKSKLGYSPDDADSLMMAAYGCIKHMGRRAVNPLVAVGGGVQRINSSSRTLRGMR